MLNNGKNKKALPAEPEPKQLFIIGSGRSGTTLVQRLFNSFPNIMIWGEHSGFLKDMAEAYFTLTLNSSMKEYSYTQPLPDKGGDLLVHYKRPERWQAWNNWFQPSDVKNIFRAHLESFFNPKGTAKSLIWGFKEIRYGTNDRVIEFLAELYPNAQFVFATRNGLNTLERQLTTFYQGESKFLAIKRILQLSIVIRISREWVIQNRHLMKLADQNGDNFHFIQYEGILKDISILIPVLKNLGVELGDAQFKILKMKKGRGSGFKEGNVDLRWKRLGLVAGFAMELIIGTTNRSIGYCSPKRLILATCLSKLNNKLMGLFFRG